MLEARVTKEYLEDVIEDDGALGDLRWWQYTFELGPTRYRARVYMDEPSVAYVMQSSDVRSDDPDRGAVLARIHAELEVDGVDELLLLGARGYEVVPRRSYRNRG